jgi:hypothetical protein
VPKVLLFPPPPPTNASLPATKAAYDACPPPPPPYSICPPPPYSICPPPLHPICPLLPALHFLCASPPSRSTARADDLLEASAVVRALGRVTDAPQHAPFPCKYDTVFWFCSWPGLARAVLQLEVSQHGPLPPA